VANHRDGGRDPTELALTVQPANTARPVETTNTILPQPVMGGLVWTIPGWPDPVSSVATPVALLCSSPDGRWRDEVSCHESEEGDLTKMW